MDWNTIIDLICQDISDEIDSANELRDQGHLSLACFREGCADGLRRALRYIEILKETEKAAMPASTAADLLEKGDNNLQ